MAVHDPNTPLSSANRMLVAALIGLTLAAYAAVVTVAALNTHGRIGLGGAPLFYDFSVFHQAGILANEGRAAEAYDDDKMIAVQHAAFPGNTLRLPWNYPPTFQLLMMPLGALPYVPAWLVWTCLLYGGYALLIWRLADDPRLRWFLLLAPGVAVNLFFGQNGVLSLVLMGGGILLLGSRPVLAGVLLGMLAYKPQLALLTPLALIAGREWRALAAAVISQAALAGLSVAVLGLEPWYGFLQKMTHPAAILSSSSDWRAVPSILTFAKTLSLSAQASTVLHWTVAALAAGAVMWGWWKSRDNFVRLGLVAAGTLLITPYLRAYDLALAILPIAVLLSRTKPTVFEKIALFAAWLLPAYLMFMPPQIQFGPLINVTLFAILAQRALFKDASEMSAR